MTSSDSMETKFPPKASMEKLVEFLSELRLDAGDKSFFTHQSKTGPNFPQGRYNIPKVALDDDDYFNVHNAMTLICNAVNKGAQLTLAERPECYAPLRADFDFKASLDVGTKRQYTEDILKQIVGFYQDEIREIVDPDEFTEDMLYCIVLEKESPRSDEGFIKDGFHLHFPRFICDSRTQDNYFQKKITERMLKEKVWNGTKYITSVDKMLDGGLANKPWMMYGSMNYKNSKSTPYLYQRKQRELGYKGKDPWEKLLSTQQWGHVYDCELDEVPICDVFNDEMTDRKMSVKYYLPLFMTIRGFEKATKLKDEVENALNKIRTKPVVSGKKRKFVARVRSEAEILADLKLIEDAKFIDMLSEERASNHDMWMDVGWTLFCISNGYDEGLQMWIDFSRKADNFDQKECEDRWGNMVMKNKTMGSLIFMAKNDSPEMFRQWKKTDITYLIENSVASKKPTEYRVSLVANSKANGRFKCIKAKQDVWIEFYNHRWHKESMEGAVGFYKFLTTEVIAVYYDYIQDITAYSKENMGNGDIEAKCKTKSDRAWKIIHELETTAFQKKVMSQCKIAMNDTDFLERANENTMLLCCENGVLDLSLGIFREGRPDDCCTFSTKRYYKEYNEGDDDVLQFDKYFMMTFPNPNIRRYTLDMSAVTLQGGNIHKKILICAGGTNGGKSAFFKVTKKMYGDYGGNFNRELFIVGRANSSGSARPELARIPGKRWMYVSEITDRDKFNLGPLKELSGDDSMYVRGLYSEGGDISPQMTTWMQCNSEPQIPGSDEATWERIRKILFGAHFVKPEELSRFPVPETFEEQMKIGRFHADMDFKSKIETYADVMLWRLFRHYVDVYKKEGIKEPKEVIVATEHYKSDNDIYLQYILENLRKIEKGDVEAIKGSGGEEESDEDEKEELEELDPSASFVSLSEIYTSFTAWYQLNYPGYYIKEKIGQLALKNELNKRLGVKQVKKDIHGFQGGKYWGYVMKRDKTKLDETQRLMKKHEEDGNA